MSKILVNSRINSTSFERLAGNLLNQAVKSDSDVIFNSLEVSNDTTINGNLTVLGDRLTIGGQDTQILDNLIVVNYGDPTPGGVFLGIGGLQVDRGPVLDPYQIVFNEVSDALEIGLPSSRAIVTPRNPGTSTHQGLAIYNNITKQFDISTQVDVGLTLTSTLSFNGGVSLAYEALDDQLTVSTAIRPLALTLPPGTVSGQITQWINKSRSTAMQGLDNEENHNIDISILANTSGDKDVSLRLYGLGDAEESVFGRLRLGYVHSRSQYEIVMDKSNDLTSTYAPIALSTSGRLDMLVLTAGNTPTIETGVPLHIKDTTPSIEYYTPTSEAALKVNGGAQIKGDLFVTGAINLTGSINVPSFTFPGDYALDLTDTSNVLVSSFTATSFSKLVSNRIDLLAILVIYPFEALKVTTVEFEIPLSAFEFTTDYQAFCFASCQTDSEAVQNVRIRNVSGTNRIQVQFTSINDTDAHVVHLMANYPYVPI